MFVICFEIFRGTQDVEAARQRKWHDDTIKLRDIGGRIVVRKGILNREIWFGVSIFNVFFPGTVQDFWISRCVKRTLRRIDELDRFMHGKAPFPPSGYNWNIPFEEQHRSNHNRLLSKAEMREAGLI